jgi:DNA polymerase-3 subunit epsilon
MHLFLDTETTGIFNFRCPIDHPAQTRVVQLGMIMADEDRHAVAELNLLVKPDGWEIPAEASAVHGITTKMCERYGLPIKHILPLFTSLWSRADLLVAHSFAFDSNMLQREYFLMGLDGLGAVFAEKEHYCTMLSSTDILNLQGPYGAKWPKLMEVYKHAFGKEFSGAHDAMADVRACQEVFYWLRQNPTNPV